MVAGSLMLIAADSFRRNVLIADSSLNLLGSDVAETVADATTAVIALLAGLTAIVGSLAALLSALSSFIRAGRTLRRVWHNTQDAKHSKSTGTEGREVSPAIETLHKS
jgi:uncharacterized BrkB/YihY/UPF0761 family membrane protein